MGWAHRNKPASGIPARGPGKPWSGPIPRYDIAANDPPPAHKSIGHMEAKEYRERLRAKLQRVDKAYDLALDDPDNRVKLAAAMAIEKRLFGDYKQVVETQADSRTDDEIRADIARRKADLGL